MQKLGKGALLLPPTLNQQIHCFFVNLVKKYLTLLGYYQSICIVRATPTPAAVFSSLVWLSRLPHRACVPEPKAELRLSCECVDTVWNA